MKVGGCKGLYSLPFAVFFNGDKDNFAALLILAINGDPANWPTAEDIENIMVSCRTLHESY